MPVKCVPDVRLLLNEFVEFMAHENASWNALITDLFRHEYIHTKDLIAVNLAAENATVDLSRMDTNL